MSPRPATGPWKRPDPHTVIFSPKTPEAPSRSWWLDTANFYENAKAEQTRLRGSQGERMVQQVLSDGAARYFGKMGG